MQKHYKPIRIVIKIVIVLAVTILFSINFIERLRQYRDTSTNYTDYITKDITNYNTDTNITNDVTKDTSKNNIDKVETKQVTIPKYHIAKVDNISSSNDKRYEYNIVVDENATLEQLKLIAKDVLIKAQKERRFNALILGFYDYDAYVGRVYTLGFAYFAPDGDIYKYDSVSTGEYDKMKFEWMLQNKDWSKQLTPKEVEIWLAWKELFDSKKTLDKRPNADRITEEIAIQYNILKDEVDAIFMKQGSWFNSNK